MKRSLFITALAAIGLAAPVALAQNYYYTPGENGAYYTAPPAPTYSPAQAPAYSADQLRQLLAPIALYPDPLLTQILAAATYPQDIAAAQQWLQYFPTPSEDDINAQPWDPSVKALVHYPSVLSMMASQSDWTAALGAAFANQPQDVMNMVQQLRSEAQAANALVSSPQQQVVNDNGAIEIIPAQPNVIYVPQYDPNVVYVQGAYNAGPLITFGPSFGIGAWLDLDWDWHAHHVNQGVHWDGDWHHRDDHVQVWRHNPGRPIIVPHNFPDRNHPDNRGPGWNDGHDSRPTFDVHQNPPPGDHPRAPERPVVGVPNHPEPRPGPTPRPVEPPRPVQPPRPVEPPRPAPRPVEQPHPQTPNGNFVGAPNSSYNRRPVEGIPHESAAPAPAPRPAPEPIARPAPAPIRSAPAAPAPAFHNEGGASVQAGRGHESMHR